MATMSKSCGIPGVLEELSSKCLMHSSRAIATQAPIKIMMTWKRVVSGISSRLQRTEFDMLEGIDLLGSKPA